MSELTNNVIPPQNIIPNQSKLPHTIMSAVTSGIPTPAGASLTHAPIMNQPGIVVESVPIAGTANIIHTVPVQNSSPNIRAAAHQASPSTSEYVEVLPKSRLADLVREIDTNLHLEDDVEEYLMKYVDEFIDRVINGACMIAKHRQDSTIEVKDVQQFLIRNYDMWIPGFGTDELKPYKRSATMESHKQRLALIRRALKKY